MPHKRVDAPHSKLPREDQAPCPLPHPPRALVVTSGATPAWPASVSPGTGLCFPLDHSLPAPFLSPHGGDTQDTQDRMESLGPGGGQLWPLLGRTQVSGLSWRHQRPCPRGRWVPGRGPCSASKGQSPLLSLLSSFPLPTKYGLGANCLLWGLSDEHGRLGPCSQGA